MLDSLWCMDFTNNCAILITVHCCDHFNMLFIIWKHGAIFKSQNLNIVITNIDLHDTFCWSNWTPCHDNLSSSHVFLKLTSPPPCASFLKQFIVWRPFHIYGQQKRIQKLIVGGDQETLNLCSSVPICFLDLFSYEQCCS